MPTQYDAVQIVADNTNVFQNRLGAEVPVWARKGRVAIVSSDSDWTFDLFVAGLEMARDCGMVQVGADNIQSIDWFRPHFEFDIVRRGPNFEVLVDVNVVTAGVGMVVIQWES